MYKHTNPHRFRNILITIIIGLLAIFVCGAVLNATRNGMQAEKVPTELPAATEAPVTSEELVYVQGFTPANGADARECPDSISEVVVTDIGMPVDLVFKSADEKFVYVEDSDHQKGWLPIDAIWVNQVDRKIDADDVTTLPLAGNDTNCEQAKANPAGPEQAEMIDFPVPGNYDPLNNEAGDLIGITYPIQDKGPHSIPSCNKCTLVVAVGKFTFSGTVANPFTGLFGASEVTGNILAGVCTNESGCVTPMIGSKAGHAQVTIVFPGFEIPNESAAWSVNFMFNPESSNCGDGCLEVYVGNLNTGAIKKFDKNITAPDLDLVAPTGPYPKINIVVDGTPSGSKVILNDAGDPIGQKYYLADKEAYISVPEDGGTIFYFGAACTRDGISQKPGDVVVESGIKSDGGTPHDQNQTVEVACSQPEMVLVHFFHGGNFDEELSKLKSEFPDWNWP